MARMRVVARKVAAGAKDAARIVMSSLSMGALVKELRKALS